MTLHLFLFFAALTVSLVIIHKVYVIKHWAVCPALSGKMDRTDQEYVLLCYRLNSILS